MRMEVLFADVRVRELRAAAEWYSRLFGRDADIVPNDKEVMWRIADGGWLYVLEDAGNAGKSLATIAVADLDAALAEIRARGIAFGPVQSVGDAARKATTEDPDDNSLALVEVAR